jgi:glucan phosphoethanolaminetransferase (alkaline phosphatase superfamily)
MDLAELRHQRWLLLKLWWWYLGPLGAAVILICAALYAARPAFDRELMRPVLAVYGMVVAGAFWFAWFINRRAVRNRIDPRLEELEELRRELDAS